MEKELHDKLFSIAFKLAEIEYASETLKVSPDMLAKLKAIHEQIKAMIAIQD